MEAIVTRIIRAHHTHTARNPIKSTTVRRYRFLAISATIPNTKDVCTILTSFIIQNVIDCG